MRSSIDEFEEKEKPDGYYERTLKELSDMNQKFHIFSRMPQSMEHGFQFSVKDNICVDGVESSASAEILEGYVPPFDATAVERMRGRGFSFIGKTKMDEFGFGTFGINCAEHPLNPINPEYVTGGSSAGAAAATAVMKYHVAIAESTGGSISCPAAFCGVVGFTPTYGLVSRYGLIDYANSLDKIGIMARRSADIRHVFDVIKGSDRYDTTCIDREVNADKRTKLIIVDQLMQNIDQAVLSAFDRFTSKLESRGYEVVHRSIPFIEKAIPAYYIISTAEASTNLAKYTGFKYGKKTEDFSQGYNEFFTEARSSLGTEAKRRVILGTFVRSASVKSKYYEKALRLRRMLIEAMGNVLSEGFIISPTMPIMPPKVEEAAGLDPVKAYSMDSITVPPNLAGFPHISFPYDYSGDFPMGAQLITSHFNDYALMDFAGAWEEDFEYRFKYNVGSL